MNLATFDEASIAHAATRAIDCRQCGQTLPTTPVLTLGNHYVVDFVEDPAHLTKPKVPLALMMCDNCRLVQLSHSVNADIMYKTFWYRSGINESMKAALKDVTLQASLKVGLKAYVPVLDIGCNDGTLLSTYEIPVYKVGIDPSNQIETEEAKKNIDYAIRDYANTVSLQQALSASGKKFKIITAIAMFYDLEDPAAFLQAIHSVLDDKGIFVIQMNYLLSMLRQNAFDNISHEHLTYYTLQSLQWIVSRCGFKVVDVELNNVNGGSLRVYLTKINSTLPSFGPRQVKEAKERIESILENEREEKLYTAAPYIKFAGRVSKICNDLSVKLIQLVAQVKRLYVYGASTRGSTLLQTIWPSAVQVIAGCAERDKNKFGLYTAGTWKLILDEVDVRKHADYFLVLPWHFFEGIKEREREWAEKGGKFIVPLPQPKLVWLDEGIWKEEIIG